MSGDELAKLRTDLLASPKEALVEFLLDHAQDDDHLRRHLVLKVAAASARHLGVQTYRQLIDQAVGHRRFIPYREAYAYTRGLDDVVDALEGLVEAGRGAEAMTLIEHALRRVESALGRMDDSDGHMSPILERLQQLHHAACVVAVPPPKVLAKTLFSWELRTDWDTFLGAAERYADLLGREGLAEYRRLAEKEWARLPALGPGDGDRTYDPGRFRITHIMETLAKTSGDLEELVAVMARDLSQAFDYLQIAELYQEAGQPDRALEWAEHGVAAFPTQTDQRLREFLANGYHRLGRHGEAMQLIWRRFEETPFLWAYQELHRHAELIDAWEQWRDRALAELRSSLASGGAPAGAGLGWAGRRDHSELVRVFLWEQEFELAWQEAQTGRCEAGLWLELAKTREKDHPADAVAVYQQQVEPIIQQTNNDAYQEAVVLLGRIRRLMGRIGQTADFPSYLATIRARHRAKRNLMKLIEGKGW